MPNAARLAFAFAMALALVPALVSAQVLYKWTDADGKVQYSDKRPKDPKGPVTIIEQDVAPTPVAPKAALAPTPAKAETAKAPPQDLLSKRRALRAELEARLTKARENLASARKALAEAGGPEPDERQVIQQTQAPGQGGMHGLSQARGNCRQVVQNGKTTTMCPAMVANDAYFERIGKLEIAVRQAEEELSEAEEAWRRGVD